MTKEFKQSMRGKIIVAAALLVILSVVFFIMRGRSDNPANGEQSITDGQSANQQKSGIESQDDAAAASKNQSSENRQPQSDKSDMLNIAAKSKTSTPVRTYGFIMQQKLISKVDPVYPEVAKLAGIVGSVVLEITIDKNGAVTEAKMVSGQAFFEEAAVDAVRQWRYEPAIIGGVKTPVSFYVSIFFQNDGSINTRHIQGPRQSEEPEEFNFVNLITDNPYDNSIRFDTDTRAGAGGSIGLDRNHEYHAVARDMSPPVIHIDKQKIRDVVNAALPDDRVRDAVKSVTKNTPTSFRVYIDETGNIDRVLLNGGDVPTTVRSALEKELPNCLRVQSPTSYNGKAIPSWVSLTIDISELIR